MDIGNIRLRPGAALAPMAGFTDAACRRLAARHGAAFTVSEMVSAKALTFGDKKSFRLMAHGRNDAPWGVQLFGAEPDTLARAVGLIREIDFDFIDINMGCPAPKITGSGAGSRLLQDPPLAGRMVRAAVLAADGRPVTVKMRLGWDSAHLTAVETALRCQEAGAAAVTVHGRSRDEMYQPGIHPEAIRAVKEAVEIPVIANGDVTSAEEALALLAATGCDGVMVGRAALGNPWLFEQIGAALRGEPLPPQPALAARMAVMRRQIEEMCEEKGEGAAMPQARSHAMHYMAGLRGAAALRRRCCGLTRFADVDELIQAVLEQNPLRAPALPPQ